jgi:hypothetical protein
MSPGRGYEAGLLQLSLRFQGRTFGTPGRPALAMLAEDERDAHAEALN